MPSDIESAVPFLLKLTGGGNPQLQRKSCKSFIAEDGVNGSPRVTGGCVIGKDGGKFADLSEFFCCVVRDAKTESHHSCGNRCHSWWRHVESASGVAISGKMLHREV